MSRIDQAPLTLSWSELTLVYGIHKLSVAPSVPVLTEVVTVVSDSPAFYSIPLHSILFHIQLLRFCKLHSATSSPWLSVLFFVSLTVTFVGTEVTIRDPAARRSRPWSCFNLWPGAASWGFRWPSSSVLRLVQLNLLILCFCQTYILS